VSQQFFVPAATDDERERIYGEFAKWCGTVIPDPGKRIYSITYVHDGTEWTAQVGETLRGTYIKRTRSKGHLIERTLRKSDPATVLAIFSGDPYMVVTNGRPLTGLVSDWVNPFMAGKPSSVTYFLPILS
jgi:hypothetical protein